MEGEHIGDGLYVSHDGYQIWLRAERDGQVHEVALEPGVQQALAEWARRFYRQHGQRSPLDLPAMEARHQKINATTHSP